MELCIFLVGQEGSQQLTALKKIMERLQSSLSGHEKSIYET